MSAPIIHFPMEATELVLMIEVLEQQIEELKYATDSSKFKRQDLILLKIRLSATYKELTGLTKSAN